MHLIHRNCANKFDNLFKHIDLADYMLKYKWSKMDIMKNIMMYIVILLLFLKIIIIMVKFIYSQVMHLIMEMLIIIIKLIRETNVKNALQIHILQFIILLFLVKLIYQVHL